MERKSLSIRKFAEVCGVSHTEIVRRMKDLNVEGNPQGKGLPTLLSPDDQDKIAGQLFEPVVAATPEIEVESVGSGIEVYRPKPLATKGYDGELNRQIQTGQLTQSLGFLLESGTELEALIVEAFGERGKQLGHKAILAQANGFMHGVEDGQRRMGKSMGVIADDPSNA